MRRGRTGSTLRGNTRQPFKLRSMAPYGHTVRWTPCCHTLRSAAIAPGLFAALQRETRQSGVFTAWRGTVHDPSLLLLVAATTRACIGDSTRQHAGDSRAGAITLTIFRGVAEVAEGDPDRARRIGAARGSARPVLLLLVAATTRACR